MGERTITVCEHCLRAACWTTGGLCLASAWSFSTEMPEGELRRMAEGYPEHFALDLRPGGALSVTPATGLIHRPGHRHGARHDGGEDG